MDKEQAIEEVMELVINAVCAGIDYGKETEAAPDKLRTLYLKEELVESKLRELINEAHQASYEAGWAEADEAMSWNRSM